MNAADGSPSYQSPETVQCGDDRNIRAERLLIFMLAAVCLSSACDSRQKSSTTPTEGNRPAPKAQISQTPEQVALTSFEKLVATMNREAIPCEGYAQTVSNVAYDVQKTDSLVSPFTATLVAQVANGRPGEDRVLLEMKLHFAFQEGQWRYAKKHEFRRLIDSFFGPSDWISFEITDLTPHSVSSTMLGRIAADRPKTDGH